MGINVIELAPEQLVEGFAISEASTISFEQLVERFGVARASELWKEYSVDGMYLDFGGGGHQTAYTTFGTTSFTTGGTPSSVVSSTDSALDLAQTSNLAADSVSTTHVAQGALKTGNGTAKYSNMLSLDVGMVGAAVAPLLGVAFGNELYQNNPEFWTKLSTKLLPFCYPGTTEIPAWTDVFESAIHPGQYETNVIIDMGVYLALKEFFEEEGYGTDVPVYPGGTGEATVVEIGSVGSVLLQAIGLIEHPIYDPSGFITSMVDEVAEYMNDHPTYGFTVKVQPNITAGPGLAVYFTTSNMIGETLTYNELSESTGNVTRITFSDSPDYHPPSAEFITASSFTHISMGTSYQTIGITYEGDSTYLGGYNIHNQTVVPDGCDEWEGDEGSDDPYDMEIVYMVADPITGRMHVTTREGLSIAVPDKVESPEPTTDMPKPENWPEDTDWPTETEFPWEKPDDYEGDWPEVMPWPLPAQKPDWWPSGLPYPNIFPYPSPSLNPELEPNPNQSTDPTRGLGSALQTYPGLSDDPKIEITPSPAEDPSKPPHRPTTVYQDPNTIDPDVDPHYPDETPEGETPPPVVPTIPTPWTPASSTPDGLVTVYHPTDAQLKAFSSWLWVTYADATIDKIWNNPFDGVIGLMEIYCTPTDIGAKTIRSGFLDSGVSSQTISRYTSINCGSITVPEYYGNYLDYSPYSKCHVYLPFIGIVELNVDDIVGHAVNITYQIDEYTGACIAQITVAKSTKVGEEDIDYSNLMYQFSGNCSVDLPLSGGSQAAIKGALIAASATGLSSVIHGIASGAAGGVAGAVAGGALGAVSGAASLVSNVVTQKSSVQHSGTFGSSYGALGIKTPYIIVTRPKQVIVVDYNTIYGYPAHKMVTIGSCEGYLRVRDVHVKSSTASDEEKKKIEELLKEGIYVTE